MRNGISTSLISVVTPATGRLIDSDPLAFASWVLFDDANTLSSLVTSTRTGTATFFDSTGTLQSAAANTPRVSYDPVNPSLGPFLLAEEQRTNSIRNNTMQGAVAGAIGGTGVAPANWTIQTPGTSPGMNTGIVGVTRISGIDYVTVRYFGTPTSNNSRIWFETALPAASDGQVWTGSLYLQQVANPVGALQTASLRLTGPGATMDETGLDFTLPTTIQRFTRTRTLSGGFTAVHMAVRLGFNVGVPIDITLRIGLPQLEQGATASSPILTSGTAATRHADNNRLPSAGVWPSEGATLYVDAEDTLVPSGATRRFLQLDDGTASNRILFGKSAPTNSRLLVQASNATVADLNLSVVAGVRTRMAARVFPGNQIQATNGVLSGSASAAVLPVVNTLRIGSGDAQDNSTASGTHIYQAAIIPRRISDAALRNVTKL